MSFIPATPFTADNPRFVWNVGARPEEFPDLPEQRGSVDLIDRHTGGVVVSIAERYGQLLCLQREDIGACAPFADLERWLNRLSSRALESEGLPTTP